MNVYEFYEDAPVCENHLYFQKPENIVKPCTHISTGNHDCSVFFGIVVAEQVLNNVFKDVVQAPPRNYGFDFWCNKGMKIDAKASCIQKRKAKSQPSWRFHINHNTIPDYFLCIAFDNRTDLNPLHLWLIPGEKVNHMSGLALTESTLYKWYEHELSIDKTITCCDASRP